MDAQNYNHAVDRLNSLLKLSGSKNVTVNISPLGINITLPSVQVDDLLTDPEMGDNEWEIV